MALRETTSKLLECLDTPEAKYERDVSFWHKKDEWKVVTAIRNRIRQMYQARQNSCYLTTPDNSESWDAHWDHVMKVFLMYTKFEGDDDFQPSLKSGIGYRTIAQLESRERKQQIDFLIEARNEEDRKRGKSVAHRYIFKDYFKRNPDIRYRFNSLSKEAKIKGTAVAYIPYTVKVSEKMEPLPLDIKREDVKAGKLPQLEFEKKMRVEFEDVDFVHWRLEDFYVDPNAQCLHGTNYAATDCAGILYLTLSQVRSMFNSDPSVKNLDRIKPSSEEGFRGESTNNIAGPKDVEEGFCEVIFYYNKETDSEVILCGHVLLKEGPIPYIDKRLPFVDFRVISIPNQFYGMGILDSVLQISAEDAAMKNMRIMNLHYRVNAPILVGSSIFGELDNQFDSIEPGRMYKVTDVNASKVLEYPQIPFDSWRVSEELKDEAVMNTGINPQGLSLPMSSTPATNTIAMKESMGDMVNMYADSLMQGMNNWGQLLESRFCQFYTQPTRRSTLELDKAELRELRLEDIVLYDKDGQLKTRPIKGSKIIPLEKSMFEWKSTPHVYISADFIAPISEAFNQRKAQEILPQLAPFAGEPGAEIKPGQKAVIDLRKLVGWYCKQFKIDDKDFVIDEDEDRLDEMEQAIEQMKLMLEGEVVVGIPGEPLAHRYTHSMELLRLNDTLKQPTILQIAQIPHPEAQEFIRGLTQYKDALAEHLRLDGLISEAASEHAVQESDAINKVLSGVGSPGAPQPGGPAMGGPEMPMNNAPSVPLVAGGMGLPNQGGVPVPNQMAPTDESGMGMY